MLPATTVLYSVFLATLAFIAGTITPSVVRPRLAARAFTAQPPPAAPAVPPVPAPAAPPPEPLGLAWFRRSYHNPWAFSTLRTGIAELYDAYDAVRARDAALPRVVVSFTSLPRRFARHAYDTVRLLKRQSYVPDAIYVAVPAASRRSNASFAIPAWMRRDPLVKVLRPPRDFGPATKLIPALQEELRLGNTHTRIVTVDDDNEGGWGEDALLELLAYSLHFEHAAIGFTGWNVTCMVSDARCSPDDTGIPQRQFGDRMYNFIRKADDYACHSLFDWLPDYYSNCMGAVRKNFVAFSDVLEGYKGVLYQPRFFDLEKLKSLLDDGTPNGFLLADDVWFSGWLGVNNVSRLVINPALHHDAPVRLALVEESKKRNISSEMMRARPADTAREADGGKVEEGLHNLGLDFTRANHDGVKWFEQHGAWTKDMWKRPQGFLYASEKRNPDRDVLR